jgi:hypothetical protein
MGREIYDKDGNLLDDEICPDGGKVVVSMPFMDHALWRAFADSGEKPLVHDGMGNPAGFRAGYAFCDEFDCIRAEAYHGFKRRLADAWRLPMAPEEHNRKECNEPQHITDAEQAWEQMRQNLQNAWRRR